MSVAAALSATRRPIDNLLDARVLRGPALGPALGGFCRRIRETTMRHVTPSSLCEIGYGLGLLATQLARVTATQDPSALGNLFAQGRALIGPIVTTDPGFAPLPKTAEALQALRAILHESPAPFDLQAERLGAAIERTAIVLKNEVDHLPLYHVEPKGPFDLERLITRGVDVEHDIAAILPEHARLDLQAAGRALAFELPTAAAFHCFRAMEATICGYWARGIAAPGQRNWHAYVQTLRAAGVDEDITQLLDHIRRRHRNPGVHPEHQTTLRDAILLVNLTSNVIDLIGRDLLQRAAPDPGQKE